MRQSQMVPRSKIARSNALGIDSLLETIYSLKLLSKIGLLGYSLTALLKPCQVGIFAWVIRPYPTRLLI